MRCRLRQLAGQHPRFGDRRLHALLRREGTVVNHKRVERLYREEGLVVRRRGRQSPARILRGRPPVPARANQQWALDFLEDALASGRKIRPLSVIDVFTREALALEVDTSLPGSRVVRVLDRLAGERERPGQLVLDNGPEPTSRGLEQGPTGTESRCTSSTRASRSRTPTARASTAGSATNASTSTGAGA
jgi:putative transposase